MQNPGKNPTSDLKSSEFQGSEPKVILNKSHAELSISAIHNRQILADKENCNFEIKSSRSKTLCLQQSFLHIHKSKLNGTYLCQNRPKISHHMTHIKRLCQKPKKPNLTQAGEGARLSLKYYCRSPTLTHNNLCNVSVRLFLNSNLFFKAREQIEKENENKSEDQQLDSSKQAMDEEDEDLLATIANKILES